MKKVGYNFPAFGSYIPLISFTHTVSCLKKPLIHTHNRIDYYTCVNNNTHVHVNYVFFADVSSLIIIIIVMKL